MRLARPDGSIEHLGYCSNIHPAESWEDVSVNLHRHLLPIQRELVGSEPFGIGLRLSAAAATDLAQPEAMQSFKQFLHTNNCYVYTINGFPYGPFHGTRVKEDVYLPDWKDEERLRYTNQLADLFAQFLPAGMTGSISTVPGAFKSQVNNTEDISLIAAQLVKHVAHLHQLQQKTGANIVLALEPEPCCFLETIDESVSFYRDWLFAERSVTQLQSLLNIDKVTAEELLHKHLTLCLDLCHAAVEFEDPNMCLDKLRSAQISIGKMQISAGLRFNSVNHNTIDLLKPFDDNVYLHQVIERHNGKINRFTDLPQAFDQLSDEPQTDHSEIREWRVHFHVPIFLDDLGDYSSTQFFIKEMLELHKRSPISEHLEVETYTWDVLPAHCKTASIDDAIVRELDWVRQALS